MSQQQTAPKPSLQGVRIKARKGAVKAQAKHEPTVFRDQLYKYIDTVPPGEFDTITNKLVQAGSTLEYLKYADALFEILLAGGLLQPGGGYIDDGAPQSPFSILQAKEPVDVEDMKKYINVFDNLIRRYKYLQKPLQESSLPGLLQYANRWPEAQKEKVAVATGLLLSKGLASGSVLQSLTKEHLVKNEVSLSILTTVLKTYLSEQSMEHLATTLRKGGVKDLLEFFPPQKQDPKALEAHFKSIGLPQIAEWYIKKQFAVVKDALIDGLKRKCENDESTEDIISFIKTEQEERPLPDTELIQCIWQGIMSSLDLSARSDQIDALVVRELNKYAPAIEPFCNGPKSEVALINVVQMYCYENARLMKAFPQILKVLYNQDCVSDQAIIYWHQKGARAQGRQHFLKAAEPLVKFLQEQDEDEEESEEE